MPDTGLNPNGLAILRRGNRVNAILHLNRWSGKYALREQFNPGIFNPLKAFEKAPGFLLAVMLAACSDTSEELNFHGSGMGTSWAVKVIQNPSTAAKIDALSIQARLDGVDRAMSNWQGDSDVAKLNNMPAGCLLVSEHTGKVATAANHISKASHGYLDVTLSPLIELWGFGVEDEPAGEPSPGLVASAMALGDYTQLSIAGRQLCKSRDETQVNYSAIAKGYAVDQIAGLLRESGYQQFLVEVGGELYGLGVKTNGEPWKVGIERPSYGLTQELYATLELNDMAVATSGDYRNYYEIDSVRYSHVINPRTGRPVQHNAASVTVVHRSAMVADAWATALLAAGPEEGLQLAEQNRLGVLMLLHDGQGFEELTSSYWFDGTTGHQQPKAKK